jgi:hypothetical protein
MDPATVHERPAKRAKRDEAGGGPTLTLSKHGKEDSDEEGPGFVDNGATHGSDVYLDTVRIA